MKPKDAEDYQRGELKDADPADAILSLRVCDPAMGSGHFLVSLVDTLADHVLNSMAEAAALGADLQYISPLAAKIDDIRRTILKNAKAANWTIDEAQLDDRHIVRRMVLKRCVYGVDKNPMAVELAKVALWLHTFTVGAPLSFIDHHLHAGDSLFGLWVRDAIDKASATSGDLLKLLWQDALHEAQRSAQAMRIIEMATDADIGEAHKSASMWTDIESQVGPLDSFVNFMNALDWLNLKTKEDKALVQLWLGGGFGDALLIVRGKQAPFAYKAKQAEVDRFTEILTQAHALIAEERFLNWQITFPGVWDNWASTGREGGFDAIVGNPPWEEVTLDQVKWFAGRRPEIAQENRAADREAMVAQLIAEGDPLVPDFQYAAARAVETARMARKGGSYSKLASGELNLYKLFVERALTLVRDGGMVGLLVPIGIGTDQSSAAFFSETVEAGNLRAFLAFENKRRWLFKDVHAEDQPTIIVVQTKRGATNQFKYAVKLHQLPDLAAMKGAIWMSAETLKRVNPITGTAPIFRTERDLQLMIAIYERLPTLGGAVGLPNGAWPVRYLRMIDMSLGSEHFREKAPLVETEGAWPTGGYRYSSPTGNWFPLQEGKMVSLYNHRYASVVQPINSTSGQGISVHSEIPELEDPDFRPYPRYWINEDKIRSPFQYAIGFNDVCNTNNQRSLLSAIVGHGAYGNKLPLLTSDQLDAKCLALLQGNLASIVCDYAARQKIQSRNLNKYILEQLPIIPPADYARTFGSRTAAEIVREAVLELTYTAHDLAPFARDMGHVDANGEVLPPFIWDEARRLNLRAKLDALYFILYGVFDPANPAASRDDIRYIYSTFPIVAEKEAEKWGSYKSEELCLAWINALMAGQPDAEIGG